MSKIPLKRQIIFVNGTLSARPTSPIPVVRINTKGPTKASNVLIYKAFSKSLNFNINNAAVTSRLPPKSLNKTINRSAFSILKTSLTLYPIQFFYVPKTLSVNSTIPDPLSSFSISLSKVYVCLSSYISSSYQPKERTVFKRKKCLSPGE